MCAFNGNSLDLARPEIRGAVRANLFAARRRESSSSGNFSSHSAMFRQRALLQLKSRRAEIGTHGALVGLDGFVDTIVTPVGLRRSGGKDFTPIATLAELGRLRLGDRRVVRAYRKRPDL